MFKGFVFTLTLLLLLTACGQTEQSPEVSSEPESYTAAAAVLEEEALSPDGRFLARTEGVDEGITAMGLYPAEHVQIADAETGEILWTGDGAYRQSILWSPEGGFAALERSARTWCSITIIETEGWTSWEFTLPDGSPIPEYMFLPNDEPWGMWQSEGSLNLTLGRGGDAEPKRYYTCAVNTRDGVIEGTTWEESRQPPAGEL